MIKVVIFDFDDTLYSNINPEPWETFCLNTVKYFLVNNNKYNILEEAKYKAFSDKQLIKFLKLQGEKEEDIQNYFSTHEVIGDIFKGCTVTSEQTLNTFANNFQLYIVSNSLESSIRSNMKKLGINENLFKQIISNDDVTKEKAYKSIILKERINSDELLVIGNSYTSDILPALNLGAKGKVICDANFSFSDFFDSKINLKV